VSRTPLFEQVGCVGAKRMRRRRLHPGDRLPAPGKWRHPLRNLHTVLHAWNTVLHAYQDLREEGLVANGVIRGRLVTTLPADGVSSFRILPLAGSRSGAGTVADVTASS